VLYNAWKSVASVCVKENDRCAVPESQIPQITLDSTDGNGLHRYSSKKNGWAISVLEDIREIESNRWNLHASVQSVSIRGICDSGTAQRSYC